MDTFTKLGILAEAARYDVACTSSGASRPPKAGHVGMTQAAGCCHSFTADGRCITLLKVLLSNACSYDCAYCVNRRQACSPRATFAPHELADLVIDFYRRNYIEGLFLSSGVLGTPDETTERMIVCLRVLRDELRFNGYIHAKVIPGTSSELIDALGRLADRLSVNLELPSGDSLSALCPEKSASAVMRPMARIRQLRDTEACELVSDALTHGGKAALSCGAPVSGALEEDVQDGQRRRQDVPMVPLAQDAEALAPLWSNGSEFTLRPRQLVSHARRTFVPAGQSTQLIVGATSEDDNHILRLSQALYRRYDLKRVFFSAYVPLIDDGRLPSINTPVPLRREHRLYQADWLMRYYGFSPDELATPDAPWLDLDVDPKLAWALAHLDRFPVEVMDAPLELLLRVPGIGAVGARRIISARNTRRLSFDDLSRLRVVLRRASHFLTCGGKRDRAATLDADVIRRRVMEDASRSAYNRARREVEGQLPLF